MRPTAQDVQREECPSVSADAGFETEVGMLGFEVQVWGCLRLDSLETE